MTSRLTSDVFIPSVPIVMPSLIAMVLNSIGVPPACANAVRHLHRQIAQLEIARHRPIQVFAMPMIGFFKSSSCESNGFQIASAPRPVAALCDGVAL